jgi:cyclopropane fatty-acyl-phospholipid synthase-like methyltransferase
MSGQGPVEQRYLSEHYQACNPTWDSEDSPWKATLVRSAIERTGLRPASIAEIGCGAGGVLASLRDAFPNTRLLGFDIAPAAATFWPLHQSARIEFAVGDFFELSHEDYDVILLLDVVEHLADPHGFLARVRGRARHFVFHFPLDLSALSVLRETPLTFVREKVGHLHYYTKSLALALLGDCGFEVLDWRYTGAAFNAPRRDWKTRLAGVARRLVYALNKDFGVRLLGGETLIVLAQPRSS